MLDLIKAIKIYNIVTQDVFFGDIVDSVKTIVFLCGVRPHDGKGPAVKKIRDNFIEECYNNDLSSKDVKKLIFRQEKLDELRDDMQTLMFRGRPCDREKAHNIKQMLKDAVSI